MSMSTIVVYVCIFINTSERYIYTALGLAYPAACGISAIGNGIEA